jgi:hypothetical protein
MTCTAIIGAPRTGKTLYLTMIGYLEFLSGRKIYANYPIYFPHTHLDIEDLLSIQHMEMDIYPKTVLIQEASKWFDSRRSGRKENVMLSSFTGQSGKREIDIFYDDQFMTRIDSGLRDITDVSYMSEAMPRHPEKPIIFRYSQFIRYFAVDMHKAIILPAFYMEQYYSMYDTRKPTESLEGTKDNKKKEKKKKVYI